VTPNDSELRARIYREAMIDAENENKRLREEKDAAIADANKRVQLLRDTLHKVTPELNQLREENERLRKEIEGLNRSNERQGETIHYLREENEKLGKMVKAVRVTLADAVAYLKA